MDHEAINLMCRHPSDAVLAKISAGTGVPMNRLREMTIGSLILQIQSELGIAMGEHEAPVVEWLTAKVFISNWSDREYWDTIEFWRRQKKHKSIDCTTTSGRMPEA